MTANLIGRIRSAIQLIAFVTFLSPAFAAPVVIHNDPGGRVQKMIDLVAERNAEGIAVEIRGNCFSSCAMNLGVRNVCVTPTATLGFHGPSSYGRPLSPEVFDQATRVIARYYPPAIKVWYMEEARFDLVKLRKVKGKTLIAMGVQQC